MEFKNKKSFTLVESILIMVVIGILAVPGAYLLGFVMQNSIFLPNQLNMDMLASDALDSMINGDGRAKGLRFCKAISTIGDYQINFVNQDGQTIAYQLNTLTGQLYRSIDGGSSVLFPYYQTTGVNLTGQNGRLFTFYTTPTGSTEQTTSTPADVRRVEISLITKTGTGSSLNWEGQSEQVSSIAVKRLQ